MDGLTRLAVDARDGDRVAMEAFVRQSQSDVWRLCAHLVDRSSADDLTQDTYVRALPALTRYRADSSARTWLLAICRRTCMDELRRRTRQRRANARLPRPEPSSPGSDAGYDLVELVRCLDVDRREAFVLTQVLGLGYAEAADVCGCPIGTIRSRVGRARAELLAEVRAAEA